MANIRQVRYNIRTETGEQIIMRHRWTFCIINEPREIGRIEKKILQALSPASDFHELAENLIRKTKGLHYHAFAISSDRGDINFYEKTKIYASPKKFKIDRRLTDITRDPDVWFEETYIPSVIPNK